MSTSRRITVPWTQEQVDALNDYQRAGFMHPYTCPDRGDGRHIQRSDEDLGQLLATPSGWICRDCLYRQNWAHAASAGEATSW